MSKKDDFHSSAGLSATQEALQELWEEHVRYEFATRTTADTLATMTADA